MPVEFDAYLNHKEMCYTPSQGGYTRNSSLFTLIVNVVSMIRMQDINKTMDEPH